MEKQRPLTNYIGIPKKAAVPDEGTAAFFRSTPFLDVPPKRSFPAIHRQVRKSVETDNLWPKTHYFRLNLADGPMPDVVLIEGQIRHPRIYRKEAA